jgi:hypothetical protein
MMNVQKRYGPTYISVQILNIFPSIHQEDRFVVNGKVNGREIQVTFSGGSEEDAYASLEQYYHSCKGNGI